MDEQIKALPSDLLRLHLELILQDDRSDLSDLTGLTGVFSACSNFMNIQYEDNMSQYTIEEDDMKELWFETEFPPVGPMHSSSSYNDGALPPNNIENDHVLVSAFRGTRKALGQSSSLKQVKFDTISIRYYERILTIHPSTTMGPSIGIGWNFKSSPTIPLEEYESNCHRHQNSSICPSILDRQERIAILRRLGVTDSEIVKGIRTNARLRHQRAQSVPTTGAFQVESILTSILKNKLLSANTARKLSIR